MRSPKVSNTAKTFIAASAVALLAAVPAFAEGPATINLTITDKGCDPMQLTVPPETVAFKIKNESKRGVEWEILKDNMVVEERENIIPGFTATLTTTLKATDYDMTCGLLSNPKGKLLVKVATKGEAEPQPGNLDSIIKTYKGYVAQETAEMVAKTKVLVEAIKAGKLDAAQNAYAPAHMYYERIEPVAEVFNDLDKSMDSRADDYEKKEADPAFSGFHRLEYGLFEKKSTDGLADYADHLMKDVDDLQGRLAKLEITPKVLVGGAAELIEEVASKKIAGEEDRYSKTDLSDFQANVDGAQKIVGLLKRDIGQRDPELLTRVEGNFGKVDKGLAKYRRADGGFESYDKLKDEDRKSLKGPITALAEDLSKLRGTLGIN